MSTYIELGTAIGQIVEQKNAAYGSSFAKAGEFLRLLWPHGLPPERFDDALLLVRIFDKQMRIATDRDAFGESPYRDIAGYGLLGAQLHAERGQQECGRVSGPDAANDAREPLASAAPAAAEPTTTSDAAPRPKSGGVLSSLPPVNSSLKEALAAAFARGATAPAPGAEEDRRRLPAPRCVWCRNPCRPLICHARHPESGGMLNFCSKEHRDAAEKMLAADSAEDATAPAPGAEEARRRVFDQIDRETWFQICVDFSTVGLCAECASKVGLPVVNFRVRTAVLTVHPECEAAFHRSLARLDFESWKIA